MNEEFKSRIENDEYQIKFVDEKTIDDIKAYKKNIVMTKGVNLLKSYRAKHPTLNKREFVIFDILMLQEEKHEILKTEVEMEDDIDSLDT